MQLTLTANIDAIARQELYLPAGYKIRPLKNEDWIELAEIYLAAYPREIVEDIAASKDEMQRTRAGEYGRLADELSPVAVINDKVVGAIMTVWQAPWKDTPKGLFIIEVFTHPYHQRKGLAKACLLWLASKAHEKGFNTLSLRVESENHSAVTLYRSLGFHDWHEVH